LVRPPRHLFSSIACAAATLIATSAAAHEHVRNQPLGPGAGLPVGSYRETCRNISLNGDRLRARCIAQNGQSVATTLSVRSCQGAPIRNQDGQLRCAPPTPADHTT
jgi:hypothetical protein